MIPWLDDPVLRLRDALVFCLAFYWGAALLTRWVMS